MTSAAPSNEVRPVPEPGPRTVAGFAAADAAGQIPVVPIDPPISDLARAPGPTADQVFRSFAYKAVGGSLLCALSFQLLPKLIGLVLGLAWWAILFVFLAGKISDRAAEEFQRGYTTMRLNFGLPGRHENRRWQGTGHRAPWDYSGLWVLDRLGRTVVSEPNRSVDPPGFYPSPNRPGEFELWTGLVWSGRYRASAVVSTSVARLP